MRLSQIAVALLVLSMPLLVSAQQGYVPLERRLSPEHLQATGLDRLSPQQMQLLNRLLGDEQAEIEARVETSTRSRMAGLDRQPKASVEAAIKGEFRGWVAGKVLELDNGQRWRVTQGELHLRRPISNARATISPGLVSGWYLQVDGQSPRAKVQRLP